MHCILCLKNNQDAISIFGESGLCLGIKEIISKHFWLEPMEDDTSLNSICNFCWESLESFHKFYEEVRLAHCSQIEIKPVNDDDDDDDEELEEEANIIDYVPESEYNGILYEAIKVELKEEQGENDTNTTTTTTTSSSTTTTDENTKCSLDVEMKYDEDEVDKDEDFDESDSEIPLSQLTKKPPDEKQRPESTSSFEQESQSKTSDNQQNIHIQDGKWLATCFGEETNDKPISHKELDKFIKVNFELTCETCRIPMKDFSSLQKHFKETHTVKTFVTCCDKKFSLRSRLVDHILLHKLPAYFTCVICSKLLSSRENLRKHMIVHDKKYDYQCEKCDKTFYRKQLLDRHMDTHVLDRKFKCDKCDKLFTSKFSLGQHIYGVHKGGYKKICEQCGKVSRDHEAFVRHQLIHTNQPKPFVECPQCGIKLVDKNGLRKHVQSQHPGEIREHICTECGIKTNTIFALRRHITFMHKKKRDHKCPVCEKAFKRALTLKVSFCLIKQVL